MRHLFFIIGAVLVSNTQATSVDNRGVVVPNASPALDTWILGRFYATAVDATNSRRPSTAAMRSAVASGVARGLISSATGANGIDYSLEEQGVISFKPIGGAAGAQVRVLPRSPQCRFMAALRPSSPVPAAFEIP